MINNKSFTTFALVMYFTHKFSNGIKLVHLQQASNVCCCGIGINTGARDQTPSQSGMAHFIEHTMFKGTARRTATQIINRLEDVGGELNAYTTKEETFVYATTLARDFERAAELISDMVFNATFPQKEIRVVQRHAVRTDFRRLRGTDFRQADTRHRHTRVGTQISEIHHRRRCRIREMQLQH